jgi:heme-degrading monooxygenase HmoA
MYARVIFGKTLTQNENVVTSFYRDDVVPTAKQQEGFKGIIHMVNPETGETLSITLWESEADMKATENNDYYKKQFAKLASFDATGPRRASYKVNVLEYPSDQ